MFKTVLRKFSLFLGLVVSINFGYTAPIFAQEFYPSWDIIEINPGAYSNNLLANQLFIKALSSYFYGDLDAAFVDFERALVYDVNIIEAHYLMGNIFLQQNKVDLAIAKYETAISINPLALEVYNNLGTALAEQGKPEEAIAIYEKALEINPNFSFANYNLGVALIQLKDYQKGLFYLQKGRDLFTKLGKDEQAHKAQRYINCGVLPLFIAKNALRHPICNL
jgi:tetratricopeptide (TPR) repeat protein